MEQKVLIMGSKSYGHRALICATLSSGITRIQNLPECDDINETLRVLSNFQVDFDNEENDLVVSSLFKVFHYKKVCITINESASTLRLLLPLLSYCFKETKITLGPRLMHRSLDVFASLFKQLNVKFILKDSILTIGHIDDLPDTLTIDGSISSQFISGLLFLAPLLNHKTNFIIKGNIVSRSYIDMTLTMMKRFGISNISFKKNKIVVHGSQYYLPQEIVIEGDYSQAAFFMAYGILKAPIVIDGLNVKTLQGDSKIISILTNAGANIKWNGNSLLVKPSQLKSICADIENCIDLGPILFVLAICCSEDSVISNVNRLQDKESDRLSICLSNIVELGQDYRYSDNKVLIKPCQFFYNGGLISTGNDHRICMAFEVLEKVIGPINMTNRGCISKSYPKFEEILKGFI